ncbi:histidine kinase [Streptomonospora nanhaiensis]|uniref:Histidine kinase n=1 Tax=Streptomonospora nanhaiensis TaxID=1323731 RepID=A0ABY6YPD9_9ACTN|nr:MHYT domain-containing protein [Streptomonospora nanhaiensis]WAE74267.1 histidine kinase [Streptomonospora nanhaiensis]
MVDLPTQDWLTPIIAFTVSAIGSFLGLAFAARARRSKTFTRWQWLALASLSLGGMALWSMHFIAMMGFSPVGTSIRYDALLTVVSGVTAVLVMGVALTITISWQRTSTLLLGGLVAGAGIVAMHYTGMASMSVHGELHHDPVYVALASAIALVAATSALWCASRLRGMTAILLASPVMAVAVTSMHYTGMLGVHIEPSRLNRYGPPPGASTTDLLLPMMTGLFVFLLVCSLFLLLGVDEERPDYARRPVHATPAPPDSERVPDAGYRPRHGAAPAPAPPAPPARAPEDDVWTRRR